MKKVILLGLLGLSICVRAQVKLPYQIFNSNGKKTNYGKMIKAISGADIVMFGELHNNSIAHWLELEVAKDLAAKRSLVFGAEMFETDNQEALTEYMQGKISAKGLDSSARLWKNYPTDYAPIVNFAKQQNLFFAATNVPRRYASLVAKGGFAALDTLPNIQKAWMPPLPIAYDSTLPGYTKMIEMMKGHGGSNLPKAQALKDATMAYNILKYRTEGSLFLHYNGSFHSENHDGICWYLWQKQPTLKILTITIVTQKELDKMEAEHRNTADFIIVVDEDMTNTY